MDKEKVVFILGAGFSKYAGAPLIDDFIPKARDIYANKNQALSKQEKICFEEVFSYHRELSQARTKTNFDIDNIEEFFGILDMHTTYNKESDLKKQALIYLIFKTLELSINRSRYDYYGNHFINKIYQKERSFSFISFNYDLILETALEINSRSFCYCLKGENNLTDVKILKLHGSANWIVCSDKQCENIEILHEKALDGLYNKKCPKCNKRMFPLIVPPTWNKRLESPYLRNVWSSAFHELSEATKIYIIGYSLPATDIYFRHFLTLSLKENKFLKKIIVCDPNTDVKKRFTSFLENNFSRRYFSFVESKFENFTAKNIW